MMENKNQAIQKILHMIKEQKISAATGQKLIQKLRDNSGKENTQNINTLQNQESVVFDKKLETCQALVLERPGSIDGLRLKTIYPQKPEEGEVQIKVKAFSLNFGDYLCVMGLYPTMPEYPFVPGIEVSGVIIKTGSKVKGFKAGDEVIGIMGQRMGAHSQIVNTDERFVVKKPDNITHEAACAFPVAYITAQRVFDKADAKQGEKILIHSAASGVGLVAIQIAQRLGLEVYATVGSQEKINYLHRMGVSNVINYRNENFTEEIMRRTDAYGVDIVINTLTGEAIQQGLDILAPEGRYIEIAMTGLKSSNKLDLSKLVDNQSFLSIDLRKQILKNPLMLEEYFSRMNRAIENGSIKPIVDKVVEFSKIAEAYSYIEKRQNIGKIVITMPEKPDNRGDWDLEGTPVGKLESLYSKITEKEDEQVKSPKIGQDVITCCGNNNQNKNTRDIAIIGISCRFPDAKNYTEFWNNLIKGRDSIIEVPKERWNLEDKVNDSTGVYNSIDCKWGGFLDQIGGFDPLFFNMTGTEAEQMDPQQRIFLEECWNALEDAGYANEAVSNTGCGVFVGICNNDYLTKMQKEGVIPEPQSFWGNAASVTASRISYFLNLKGPSMAVDTACSSSLVAIHLGCQSILSGECDMAIAGGVSIYTTPTLHISSGMAGMLSADGKCKTFDNDANGFVPGEGAGALILKPLERARADRDNIYAVIKASGINQDGKTNGITAPSTLSQTELELSVYDKGCINPETISYIEAHGTGTKLGDPIEIEALTNSFRKYTEKKGFCAIGSVKTNIGHTVAAAGIAGVIKIILAMVHEKLPPTLNFNKPNAYIDFDNCPFYVNTFLRSWESSKVNLRRAAVSSFGFGGTNCHMVLEEPALSTEKAENNSHAYIFLLSAKTESALCQRVCDLLNWLNAKGKEHEISDISFTLNVARKHFPLRCAFIAMDIEELTERLENWVESSSNNISKEAYVNINLDGEALIKDIVKLDPLQKQYKEKLSELLTLYTKGCDLDWKLLYSKKKVSRISLPTYPFDREYYWFNTDNTAFEKYENNSADAVQSVGERSLEVVVEAEELTNKVEEYLKEFLSKETKIPVNRLDSKRSFYEYGIDSIMVMRLMRELDKHFGELSKTLFLENHSIAKLSKSLVANYRDTTKKLCDTTEKLGDAPEKLCPNSETRKDKPLIKALVKEEVMEKEQSEVDIAVIGISGRYPMAKNLEEFWDNIKSGRDCISIIPEKRWDYRKDFSSDKNESGKTYSKWGGFIDDVDKFDPLFFNISPKDAELMDPQERLFLETVWHTIEDAGYTRKALNNKSVVGVFVGFGYSQYELLGAEEYVKGNVLPMETFSASIANRVSYLFDFKGPSIAVDTMCSSSFTALQLACDSIKLGHCNVAVVGGVNLSLHPSKYIFLSQGGFLSSDGRCRSFAEGGDGYVPGEGVGAVLLKPLKKAEKDKDHIYGVIKGLSINHNGKTGGYMVPNKNAQAELIEQTLKKTAINPRTISYIEAQAIGSMSGDLFELEGLTSAFGTELKRYCPIGTVKSNIGHLEAASGIAGLTKVLLQMKYRQLVPSIHNETLNSNINFNESPFYVQKQLEDWKQPVLLENNIEQKYPRRAGISAFGAGGSNVHIIVEEYIKQEKRYAEQINEKHIIILSAKDGERLKEYARNFAAFLENRMGNASNVEATDKLSVFDNSVFLEAIAYTLQIGREAMRERVAVVVSDVNELCEKMQQYSKDVIGTYSINNLYSTTQADIKAYKEIKVDTDIIMNAVNSRDLDKIAKLWVAGNEIAWELLHIEKTPEKISLPLYPFAEESYWIPKPDKEALISSEDPFTLEKVQADVKNRISKILRLSTEKIKIDENLMNYGFNSLTWMKLANSLKSDYGNRVTIKSLLGHTTIVHIADYIFEEILKNENKNQFKDKNINTPDTKQKPNFSEFDNRFYKFIINELKQGTITPKQAIDIEMRVKGEISDYVK